MGDQVQKWIEWDGRVPAWSLLLVGLSAVAYGWNWVNDIENRLKKREEMAATYKITVDNLVKDQSRLIQLEVEIKYIRAGIERLENKFSQPPGTPKL